MDPASRAGPTATRPSRTRGNQPAGRKNRYEVNKTTTQTKVHVTLKLPRPVLALIALAKAIGAALAAHPGLFPSPVPSLAKLASDTTALDNAQAVVATRVKGSVEARNAARVTLVATLNALRAYVQTVCDADPANAPTTAQNAGMSTRPPPSHNKPALSAKPNPKTSGSVDVSAKVTAKGSHEWQFSTDGGKTYVSCPPTTQAKTTITGLTPGSTVLVRHRAVTKTGPDNWGDPVSLVVV